MMLVIISWSVAILLTAFAFFYPFSVGKWFGRSVDVEKKNERFSVIRSTCVTQSAQTSGTVPIIPVNVKLVFLIYDLMCYRMFKL